MDRILTPELITHIVTCDSVRPAAMLSAANKKFQELINLSIWLDVATNITGYNAREHAKDMHDIKLLICPWLSRCAKAAYEFNRPPPRARTAIAFEGSDNMLMSIRIEGVEIVFEFPCHPKEKNTGAVAAPNKTVPARTPVEEEIPEIFKTNIPEARVIESHRVHKGVYAIFELFRESVFNGVYYFAAKDNRMLRHAELPTYDSNVIEVSMCTRPKEIWILVGSRLLHHIPANGPERLASPGDRVDTALWHAYYRRPEEAIRYLKDSSIRINQKSHALYETTLHYAAMSGDVKTIRMLVEAKADVKATDYYERTPLLLAAQYLHIDAFRELIRLKSRVTENVILSIGEENKNDVQAIIRMIDAIPRDENFHLSIVNDTIARHPEAVQHAIRQGAKTSTMALSRFIDRQTPNSDVESTIALFSDNDIKTKYLRETILELAIRRRLSANTIAYIRKRTGK
jgi:Ankyrin repeats (many copies)